MGTRTGAQDEEPGDGGLALLTGSSGYIGGAIIRKLAGTYTEYRRRMDTSNLSGRLSGHAVAIGASSSTEFIGP